MVIGQKEFIWAQPCLGDIFPKAEILALTQTLRWADGATSLVDAISSSICGIEASRKLILFSNSP